MQEKAEIAGLEVITDALKTKFPKQSLPSKEVCAQIGEEYAAATEGLAQLATAVSPDLYTMILNAAALPKIQLVVPGTSICPLTAPPPPQPEQTTAHG